MSTPLHELGGLSVSEVELRILQSKVETGEMLDEKLGVLKEDINARMDRHETNVSARLDTQDKQMQEVLDVVKSIDKKSDGWHSEDLTYRSSVESRLKKLEDLMRSLKVWLFTLRAFTAIRNSTLYVVKEGKPFLVAIAAFCSAWLAIIQFIHTVWPDYIHPWLLHFKHH